MRAATNVLLVFVTTLVCMTSASIYAATASASATERCRALPTEDERFACMEDALRAAQAALSGERTATTSVDSAPAPISRPPSPAATSPATEIVLPAIVTSRASASANQSGAAGPQGLGAEQLRGGRPERGEEPRARAMVVGFREYVPGLLEIELDNGQVWRQISGDAARVRLTSTEPQAVEMWSSWAGGYRMRLVDSERTLRVERLR